MRTLALAFLCALALALAGCSTILTGAVRAVNASHAELVVAHDTLADAHRSARDAALELAKTEDVARATTDLVQDRFRPAWDAYDKARLEWLSARAVVQAALTAEAIGTEPDLASVTRAVGEAVSAWQAFHAAIEGLQKKETP